MRFFAVAFAAACCLPLSALAQINAVLYNDPPVNLKFPAANVEVAVPSHGEKLFGQMLLAEGNKPHPTAILLHGFPGYEQNGDVAQALRRAGWNVLAVHYRGSWGTGGGFSFTHCLEDADAMVDFVMHADPKFHVDPKQVVVIGHSMGGFIAEETLAHHPELMAGVIFSGANPATDTADYQQGMDASSFLPLAKTSAAALMQESAAHRAAWDPALAAAKIAPRPVLVVSAEDGLDKSNEAFATALTKAGSTKTQYLHMRTDHAFATRRVALTSLVVSWLARQAKM